MSILIKGLKMPQGDRTLVIVINSNGTVERPNWQWDYTLIKGAEAIPVPDHGDLIEKAPLFKKTEELEEEARAEFERYVCGETNWEQMAAEKWRTAHVERIGFKYDIVNAPVVIPAERSEE